MLTLHAKSFAASRGPEAVHPPAFLQAVQLLPPIPGSLVSNPASLALILVRHPLSSLLVKSITVLKWIEVFSVGSSAVFVLSMNVNPLHAGSVAHVF
jgi:hypothetical protein